MWPSRFTYIIDVKYTLVENQITHSLQIAENSIRKWLSYMQLYAHMSLFHAYLRICVKVNYVDLLGEKRKLDYL